MGEGLNTAFQKMKEWKLRSPEITIEGNYVAVVLPHTPLASPEETVLEFLFTAEGLSANPLPPQNISGPRAVLLVHETSSPSFGSILAPRYGVSALGLRLRDSAWPSAWSGDSSAPPSPRRLPVSVRRFSLAPILPLVAIPYRSLLSFPIWPPPVETSRLGDISIVVTSPKGDISNVAVWGHYQCRATLVKILVDGKSLQEHNL
jgi:hypothetical protein